MNPLNLFTVTTLALASLIGCSSPGNESAASRAATAPIPFPPGEYLTAYVAPAAATPDDFVLAIKAFDRKDISSIKTLRNEGLAFNLPKGTRVALLPAEVDGTELPTSVVETINGTSVCNAMVESGERIGTEVALGCNSLNSASQ